MVYGHIKSRISKIHFFKDFNVSFQKEIKILIMKSTETEADNRTHSRVSLQVKKLTLCHIRVVNLVRVKLLQELNKCVTYVNGIFEC